MPTSAHWEVSNLSKITVKTVRSAWADVGTDPYMVLNKFAAACRAEQSPAPTNCVRFTVVLA